MEYILIGQLGRALGIEPLMMYHLTKLYFLFFYTVNLLCHIKNIQDRFFTGARFWLVLLSTGISIKGNILLETIIENLPKDTLPNARFALAAPHFTLGSVMAMISIYTLSRALTGKHKIIPFGISILSGMIVSYVYFPIIILILGSYALYCLFYLLQKNPLVSWKSRIDMGVKAIVYLIFVSLPAVYIYFFSGFISGTNFNRTEQLVPFDSDPRHYLLFVGIVYIFAIIGAVSAYRKGSAFLSLLAGWVIVHPIAVYVLAKLFGFNMIRFFYTPYYIVFALLAVRGIEEIISLPKIRSKHMSLFVGVCSALLILLPGLYTIQLGIQHYTVCFCFSADTEYGYPRRTVMEGLWWLRDNTHENDIVLSDFFTGNLIPAFAGNWIYTSWWHYLVSPPNIWDVQTMTNAFFTRQYTDENAYNFLKTNNIRYILYYPNVWWEQPPLQYPFLIVRYHNPDVTIYQVKI